MPAALVNANAAATAGVTAPGVAAGGPTVLRKEDMAASEGASLIARAHALNHFIDMQAQAQAAAAKPAPPAVSTTSPPQQSSRRARTTPTSPDPDPQVGCLCFGGSTSTSSKKSHPSLASPNDGASSAAGEYTRPPRAYFPDNLSEKPQRHTWEPQMEWLIIACVDFLENDGLDEPNLFAVSAVDDLVKALRVPVGVHLPRNTDPHVASGAIKAQIRYADEPLVSKDCLRAYIEAHQHGTPGASDAPASSVVTTSTSSASHLANDYSDADGPVGAALRAASPEFRATNLATAVARTYADAGGARRAYVLARILRLLGRVTANRETSKMNAHCLAKCVAPSMLHWDPNSTFSLLMLGKITAYIMAMIEEARVHDQELCEVINALQPEATPSMA